MKMIPLKAICGSLALSALMAVGGCASSPDANLYVLKQLDATSPQSRLASNISVLVRPVVLPDYLQRPEILFKSSDSRITVNEYDQWAGSLEDNITSVITANLATYLNTDEAFDYHANFIAKPDVTVRISMHEFGRVDDSTIVLNVSWELVKSASSQPRLFTEKFTTSIQRTEAINSKKKSFWKKRPDHDLTPETQAMSQALDQLSQKISEQIVTLIKNGQS